jgi:hypothetical protein
VSILMEKHRCQRLEIWDNLNEFQRREAIGPGFVEQKMRREQCG